MKQGATRLRRVPETAEEIAAMPARASADSAAATRAIPVNLMPLIQAYRKRGRFMLRIENLPQHARFSAGQNNGDGSWSLALDELDELVYFVPKNASGGDHALSIRLIAKEDSEAFTLALIDFPILGMNERESAGFPKPVESGPSRDILRELEETQSKLAHRDTELTQLRASAERMGVLLQQKLDQAVADAEANWRAQEPGRFAVEKAKLEGQFEQRLAERESRVQAIADIAREQQAAQIRRLAQELGTAQETLASRDGELGASRAALERARGEVESEIAAARKSAEAKAIEALKTAEAEWQTKAGKALAEMTARRDQAEAALTKAQAALAAADASGELQHLLNELEQLRLKSEADAAAKDQAEAKLADALKAAEIAQAAKSAAETEGQARAAEDQARAAKALAEMKARADAAEAALTAAEQTGSGHNTEMSHLRADLERQRFQLEMDLLSAKVAMEEKATEALKAAEAGWQARADEALAAAMARAERAEQDLAEARTAAQPNADREMALNQLRRELEHQRVKAQEDIAAIHAAADAKAVEGAAALAAATERADAAEAALAKTPSSGDHEIALNQLRRELEHQRLKAQGEISAAQSKQTEIAAALAAMTARAEAAETSLAGGSPSSEQEIAALRRELENQRLKAQSELAVANTALEARMAEAAAAKAAAARLASEREAEVTQLRTEFEQKGKAAESAIAALRVAVDKDSAEKLKTAEARWQKEKAMLQAEMIERTETAEATLARARRIDSAKADDDAYVHSLEREIKSLRATLADREISIVQNQAMQEHARLGTLRDTPGGRWQPLMGPVGADPEELTQQQKARRKLFRDVAVVVAVAAAAVLFLPKLEANLPDTIRWQIETLGGNFIPGTTEAAPAPQPAAAAVQPKAEHAVMYTARAVNVRAEPSVSAPIAANLKRGAQVSVLERRGNWDRVEIVAVAPAGGQAAQQGWVYSSYLTDTDPGAS